MTGRVTNINLSGAELEKALYRIYPIWLFDMALTVNGGNLALVQPSAWEDPQEDPCVWMQMRAPTFESKPLEGYLRPVYAQCWSFEGQSDALLRAYSRVTKDAVTGKNVEPRGEGAKVRTTPRLLIDALTRYLQKRGDDAFEFYIARIEYVDQPAQEVFNRLAEIGPTKMGVGFDRARSVTFKRKAFSHEQEVRIIAVAKPGTGAKYVAADVDRNQVFLEIQFDPRLAEFERLERERHVRSLGYTGDVTFDLAYMRVLNDVQLPKHWDQLDAEAK